MLTPSISYAGARAGRSTMPRVSSGPFKCLEPNTPASQERLPFTRPVAFLLRRGWSKYRDSLFK